ncbi:MAG: LysM peptidoglycan-binding domain-containing protein [Myxococcota bacterium]|jgi:hypothetical protein|nr:LysM peptidoglycan-binding domain-containing protein [Myxococcota bacterium]
MRRAKALLIVIAAAVAWVSPAAAYTHVARSGETLLKLAQRYYGRTELSIVIRAANGFVHPDDGSIAPGELVDIPEVLYHRTRAGETLEILADRYLATPKRGPFLAEMNGMNPDQSLAEGTIVKIPYHLRHIFASGETVQRVAKLYYGNARQPTFLKSYNFVGRNTRFSRGDVVIVPLIDLEFTKEEHDRIDAERRQQYSAADAELQRSAVGSIAKLKEVSEAGRYVEVVALASGLLARFESLTVPQQIGTHKYLAIAYVALDEHSLAQRHLTEALKLQPEMELSPLTTSPKVLDLLKEVRGQLAKPGTLPREK